MDALDRLHDREQVGSVVLYVPKQGMEKEAARAWSASEVCPRCHRRAIVGARCIQCGWTPEKGLDYSEQPEDEKNWTERLAGFSPIPVHGTDVAHIKVDFAYALVREAKRCKALEKEGEAFADMAAEYMVERDALKVRLKNLGADHERLQSDHQVWVTRAKHAEAEVERELSERERSKSDGQG